MFIFCFWCIIRPKQPWGVLFISYFLKNINKRRIDNKSLIQLAKKHNAKNIHQIDSLVKELKKQQAQLLALEESKKKDSTKVVALLEVEKKLKQAEEIKQQKTIEEKNRREQREKTVRSKNENLEMVTLKKTWKWGT